MNVKDPKNTQVFSFFLTKFVIKGYVISIINCKEKNMPLKMSLKVSLAFL